MGKLFFLVPCEAVLGRSTIYYLYGYFTLRADHPSNSKRGGICRYFK